MKEELLNRLETLLDLVIEEDGYQEMADGVERAIEIVEKFFEERGE